MVDREFNRDEMLERHRKRKLEMVLRRELRTGGRDKEELKNEVSSIIDNLFSPDGE
jgi:hypothetical protein